MIDAEQQDEVIPLFLASLWKDKSIRAWIFFFKNFSVLHFSFINGQSQASQEQL